MSEEKKSGSGEWARAGLGVWEQNRMVVVGLLGLGLMAADEDEAIIRARREARREAARRAEAARREARRAEARRAEARRDRRYWSRRADEALLDDRREDLTKAASELWNSYDVRRALEALAKEGLALGITREEAYGERRHFMREAREGLISYESRAATLFDEAYSELL